MIDVHSLMPGLSKQRPIFHSEADFQHALAWHIHETIPESEIRLEFPVRTDEQNSKYLDIWLSKMQVAIELKYFSTKLELNQGGETYRLKEHAATDLARKHFVQDVKRLERLIQDREHPARAGIAVLLTNCPLLWEANRGWRMRNDVNFRIHEGGRLAGKLVWLKDGQPYEGEVPVQLSGAYDIQWHDYWTFPEEVRGHFRYLAVSVEP